MRQILTDHARRRMLAPTEELDEREIAVSGDDAQRVIEIDAILERLGAVNPRLVEVVNCRFFAGYTEEETAMILGISDRTVRRDWEKARAWLGSELGAGA